MPAWQRASSIVSGIIRKRWGRAINAVRVCNYIPKFIQQIYTRRALVALSQAALLTARLVPRLEALGGVFGDVLEALVGLFGRVLEGLGDSFGKVLEALGCLFG